MGSPNHRTRRRMLQNWQGGGSTQSGEGTWEGRQCSSGAHIEWVGWQKHGNQKVRWLMGTVENGPPAPLQWHGSSIKERTGCKAQMFQNTKEGR